MGGELSGAGNILPLMIVVVALGFLPFLAIALTAFVKISVALMIVRNALGVQQTPPNLVLYGISAILSVYIAAPILAELQAVAGQSDINLQSIDGWAQAFAQGAEPVKTFLRRFAQPQHVDFFHAATREVWSEEAFAQTSRDDLPILIPAFMVSELTRAFEIGFLLYLPFLVVDLIVSAVLMSLGMMMVSPVIISVPFKLFLFVAVDGWSRLVQGLVLSYAIG